MRINEAIAKADGLRDNTLGVELKAAWLRELDGQIAEIIGVERPATAEGADEDSAALPMWPFDNTWPEEDAALLMPSPHDGIYTLYLCAMIDYYNAESELYQNDMAVYNGALAEARAWWQRTHTPKAGGPFRAW